MLVISRKSGEGVRVGDTVVQVGDITRGIVKLLINSPRDVPVIRAELVRNVVHAQPVEWLMEDVAGPRPLVCRGTIS